MAVPERPSEAKLTRILHLAAVVFAERGFEGASIRDISRASGVSLSSLYYYFKSKQELLYLIQYKALSKVLENLRERLAGVRAPEERLRKLVENHVEYFLAHPAEMKVLSHEEEALGEPYRQEVAGLPAVLLSAGVRDFCGTSLLSHHSVPPSARGGLKPVWNDEWDVQVAQLEDRSRG